MTELGAKPVHGTMASLDVLRDAAAAAEAVIHLGFDGTADAAAADLQAATALQSGVGSGVYVHTGGVWVYGNTDGVVTEDAPQNPPQITAWRAANEATVLSRGHAVLVMPGLVFGRDGGLIPMFFGGSPVPVIGDGSNHWALVHVDDIADLYVRALTAPAGSTYIGVSFNKRVADFFAGAPVKSVTYEEAVAQMGPIAEAFALDQQLSGDKARRELGWEPRHLDVS